MGDARGEAVHQGTVKLFTYRLAKLGVSMRLLLRTLLFLAVFASALPLRQLEAARWGRTSDAVTTYGFVGKVCRDGAVAAVALDHTEADQIPRGVTETVEIIFPNTLKLRYDIAVGGAMPQSVLVVDRDEQNGLDDSASYVYYGTRLITWSLPLIPGQIVSITKVTSASNVGSMGYAEISDCGVADTTQMAVTRGGSTFLSNAVFEPAPAWIRREDTQFQLDRTPAYGVLLLNSTALTKGGVFTSADIDSGRLIYRHQSFSSPAMDSFSYSPMGMAIASLPVEADVIANSASDQAAVSGGCGRVAFRSYATNMVPGDTNGLADIFLRELYLGNTLMISSLPGVPANGTAAKPAITNDGRHVVFQSLATNLYPEDDADNLSDIFLYDRFDARMPLSRVSTRYLGSPPNGDLDPNGESFQPDIGGSIFHNGYGSISFGSTASDILGQEPATPTLLSNVFMRSADGSWVASCAKGSDCNLLSANGSSVATSIGAEGSEGSYLLSTLAAFESSASNLVDGDFNGVQDVFATRRIRFGVTETELVSVSSAGEQGDASSFAPSTARWVSVVAFHSWASNLVMADNNNTADVFVRRVPTKETLRASQNMLGGSPDGASLSPDIASLGDIVAFESDATNLVTNDTNGFRDIYVRDMRRNVTRLVSIGQNGALANGPSYDVSISDDGHCIAFTSKASNLVQRDRNGPIEDVFVSWIGDAKQVNIQIVEPRSRISAPVILR